jgi:cytochrome c peroxidase
MKTRMFRTDIGERFYLHLAESGWGSSRSGVRPFVTCVLMTVAMTLGSACRTTPAGVQLETDNPLRQNEPPPYGMEEFFADAPRPVPERVRLGRWLFFDRRLSADGSVSCATCHRPEYGFSEPLPVPSGIGQQRGRRKTPSIVNLASRTVLIPAEDRGPMFFWDGRATSLERQVLMPISDPKEMGMDHSEMISRLSTLPDYRRYFFQAFASEAITGEVVAVALSEYVRTRMSGNAPFDRWEYGKNPKAISVEARLGYDVFSFKGRCGMCHAGFNFSDGLFHNLGVGWDRVEETFEDEGRREVTGAPEDTGKFKTPGLRDVEKRPPYMHDGSLRTLRDVVEFYNQGGIKNPWQTPRLRRPLELTSEEVEALVAFLRTLNGEGYDDSGPKFFPQ